MSLREKHFKEKGVVNSVKGKRDTEDTGWKALPLQFGHRASLGAFLEQFQRQALEGRQNRMGWGWMSGKYMETMMK